MRVASIALETKEHVDGEVSFFPRTIFSLSPSETLLYRSIRKKHDDLERSLKTATRSERRVRESAFRDEFLDFIRPYFERSNLLLARAHVFYGPEKEIQVETPRYQFFDEGRPLCAGIQVHYFFSIKDDALSCMPHLSYDQRLRPGALSHGMVWDLLQRTLDGVEADGIGVPLCSFDSFISFGSTDHAKTLLLEFKKIFDALPEETIRSIDSLYRERLAQKMLAPDQNNARLDDLLRKEYERTRDFALAESGFLASKMRLVQ